MQNKLFKGWFATVMSAALVFNSGVTQAMQTPVRPSQSLPLIQTALFNQEAIVGASILSPLHNFLRSLLPTRRDMTHQMRNEGRPHPAGSLPLLYPLANKVHQMLHAGQILSTKKWVEHWAPEWEEYIFILLGLTGGPLLGLSRYTSVGSPVLAIALGTLTVYVLGQLVFAALHLGQVYRYWKASSGTNKPEGWNSEKATWRDFRDLLFAGLKFRSVSAGFVAALASAVMMVSGHASGFPQSFGQGDLWMLGLVSLAGAVLGLGRALDWHLAYNQSAKITGRAAAAIETPPPERPGQKIPLNIKVILAQASPERLKRLMMLMSDDGHGPMVAIDHVDAARQFGDGSLNVAVAQKTVIDHMDYVHGFLINPYTLAPGGLLSEDVPIKPVIMARWEGNRTDREGKKGAILTTQQDENPAITLDQVGKFAAAIKFCVYVDSRHPDGIQGMVSKIEEVVREAHERNLPVIIEVLPARVPDMQAMGMTKPAEYAQWLSEGTIQLTEAIAHIPYEGIKYSFLGTLSTKAGHRVMSDAEINGNFARMKKALGGRLGFILSGGVNQDLPQQMEIAAQHNLLAGFLCGRALWRPAFDLPSGSPTIKGTRQWDLEQGDSRERYLRARAILMAAPLWYVQAGYEESEWQELLHQKGLLPDIDVDQIRIQPISELIKRYAKAGYWIPGGGPIDVAHIEAEMEDLRAELPQHASLFFDAISMNKLEDLRRRLGLRNSIGPCRVQAASITLLDPSSRYRMIYRLDFSISVPDLAFHRRLAELRNLLESSRAVTAEILDEKGIAYDPSTRIITLLYNGITIDSDDIIRFPAIVKISSDLSLRERESRQLALERNSESTVVHGGGLFTIPTRGDAPERYAIVQAYVDGVVVTDTQNADVRNHLGLIMQAVFETFLHLRVISQGTLRRLAPWKILAWYDYALRRWKATLIDLKDFEAISPEKVLDLVAIVEELCQEEMPVGLPTIGIEPMLSSIQLMFPSIAPRIMLDAYQRLQPHGIRKVDLKTDIQSATLRGLYQILRRRFSPVAPPDPISDGVPDIMNPSYAQVVLEEHRRAGAVREIPLDTDEETAVGQSMLDYAQRAFWTKPGFMPADIAETLGRTKFFLVDNLGPHNMFMKVYRGEANQPRFIGWFYDPAQNEFYISTGLLERYFLRDEFGRFLYRAFEMTQCYAALKGAVERENMGTSQAHDEYMSRHRELFGQDEIYSDIVRLAEANLEFERIPWRSSNQGIHLINSYIESNIQQISKRTAGALLILIDGVRKVGKTYIVDHLKRYGISNILPGSGEIRVYHYDDYLKKERQVELAELIKKLRANCKIIVVEGVGSLEALLQQGVSPDLLIMMTAGLLTRQANMRRFSAQEMDPINHRDHIEGILRFVDIYDTFADTFATIFIDNSTAGPRGRRLNTNELQFFFHSGVLLPDEQHMAIHHPIPRHLSSGDTESGNNRLARFSA